MNIAQTNRKDIDKKLEDYKQLLLLQSKLNAKYEAANNERYFNEINDIPAAPSPFKSVEEELQDTVLQNEKALNSIKSVMTKGNDAAAVLTKLRDDNEVNDFNRFSGMFLNEIKDQQNLTPLLFDGLWQKYKEKLAKTNNTGIQMSAEAGEYDTRLDVMASAIEELSNPDLPKILGRMRERAVELAGSSLLELSKRFLELLSEQEKKDSYVLVPNVNGTEFKEVSFLVNNTRAKKTKGVLFKTRNPDGDIKQIALSSIGSYLIRYILYKEFNMPFGQQITWTGNPDTVVLKSASSKMFSSISPAEIKKKSKNLGKTAVLSPYPLPSGSGVKLGNIKLGNKKLNLSSLNKNYLHILHNCGAYIKQKPKIMISDELKMLMLNYCNPSLCGSNGPAGRVDEELYECLDQREKDLFDETIKYCQLNRYECLNTFKNRMASSKEKKDDIKRFNLLRGQILAGNNNPDILKELKTLVLKLQNRNIISKQELNSILYEIFIAG